MKNNTLLKLENGKVMNLFSVRLVYDVEINETDENGEAIPSRMEYRVEFSDSRYVVVSESDFYKIQELSEYKTLIK